MFSSIYFYESFLQDQRFLQVSYFNFFKQIIYCLLKTLQEFQFQLSTSITILVYALCILNLFNPYEDDRQVFQKLVYAINLNPLYIFILILSSNNIQYQMYDIFQCLDCKSNKFYAYQNAPFHFSLDYYFYASML